MTQTKAASRQAVSTQPKAAKAVPATAPKALSAKRAAPSTVDAAAGKLRQKLVRDSFTIPKPEYAVLEALKLRAANLTRPAKKSELLRAGINVLDAMNDKAFLAALAGVPSLKTGRPKTEPAAKTPPVKRAGKKRDASGTPAA